MRRLIPLRRLLVCRRNVLSEFSISGSRNVWYNNQYIPPELIHVKREACEYPEIVDMSKEGQEKHCRKIWQNSVKTLPSVEEKLFEMAIQQKLDLKTYTLSAAPPTYNGINLQNYVTRTHFIEDLPDTISKMNVDAEIDGIRDVLCETLLHYYYNTWEKNKSKTLSHHLLEPNAGSKLASSLISQCFKKLSLRNNYVLNSTIQHKPRIFSFWWHGGFGKEEDEVDEQNLCFQYEDYGTFAIRTKDPLLPVVDRNDELCCTPEVPNFNFHPDVFHLPVSEKSRVAAIPGYWPADPHKYPFLLVLTNDKFKSLMSELEFYDETKIVNGAAIVSSFAWLSAVAMYHGFTPFHDITYPLVTQTIITNGQDWNFYLYQLNTMSFHNDVDQKDRRNICWSSGKLRLFDTIEDGKVKGINEEVFKVLLKFLHNVPQARDNVDMTPYLGTDTRTTEQATYMRYLLHKHYSRRPGHMDHLDEVPMWVKIYKLHPDAPPSPFIRLE